MAHQYEVHTNDGKSYDVSTPNHHEDHDDGAFRRHLLDVIKGAASGVIAQSVVRYVYRGRH